ncbi:MAG: FKBP-type peptidyl-prolyl cis-trans isomerase [Bernardetiaceae bacterium]
MPILALLIWGCNKNNGGEVTTKDGVRYINHTKQTEGQAPDSASVIDVHFSVFNDADSLINSSYGGVIPMPQPLLFSQAPPYLSEALKDVRKGDSLSVRIPAKVMFPEGDLPPFVDEKGSIRMELKIDAIYNMMDYQKIAMERREQAQAKVRQLQEASKPKEEAAIESYLQENNLTAQRTETGLYYILETAGDTAGIRAGDVMVVHYRGELLDGTPFDNSYDRGEPFEVPIMQGQVISGWDEGIPLIGKGGKGTLLIPSHLAYGPDNRSEVIKAFSTLKFDVEVLDVKRMEESK